MVEQRARATGQRTDDLVETMRRIGLNAKAASRLLAHAASDRKNGALLVAADSLIANSAKIRQANALDVGAGKEKGMAAALLDRLALTDERIEAMADGLRQIAALEDPVGRVIAGWERPNGLMIERVRTPLGVIGVIFESRPNVTADAGGLCLKSGNAVILRGGSDSYYSSMAIHACLADGLFSAGLPLEAIQIVPMRDRAAVGEMLTGLDGTIDVIVPRGGRSLVERVQREARVPIFAHLEGLCHIYVDRDADLPMALAILVNAKLRRTGICGAVETILIDRAVAESHVAPICRALIEKGCEVRGDDDVCGLVEGVVAATEEDWQTEYLDAIVSVRLVDGIGGAVAHIERYSSHHTEAVITSNPAVVERFFNEVDSAILLHNASTQFADGGEFGMGAEIGIATGKMHARGPVGVEQLTSFNYRVHGNGQIRP